MECEYCGKNTATVEVAINDDEAIYLCWFCAESGIAEELKAEVEQIDSRTGEETA